jgi:hypothetical protein
MLRVLPLIAAMLPPTFGVGVAVGVGDGVGVGVGLGDGVGVAAVKMMRDAVNDVEQLPVP